MSVITLVLLRMHFPLSSLAAQQINFDDLVQLANSYGFPTPPKNARPVLAHTGWTTVVGNQSTSHDPGIYHPAFLLKQLPNNEADVLIGWQVQKAITNSRHRPATRAFSLARPRLRLKGYALHCNELRSFATALQFATRGDLRKAHALWRLVKSADYFDEPILEKGLKVF